MSRAVGEVAVRVAQVRYGERWGETSRAVGEVAVRVAQVTCSRRTSMKEKAQLAQQEVLWQEIKMSRSASAKASALARRRRDTGRRWWRW